MNKIQKVVGIASVAIMTALPFMASADTAFGTSTAITTYNTFQTDVSLIIGTVVGGLLALMGALIGLGWATRKFKHYVSGRKF